MARPRKEGMEYFPHDTDAVNDEKIDSMRALFGNNGYAFYFILCERIYRTNNAELDISKPVLLTPLIKKLLVTPEEFNEMLEAACELGLFDGQEYEQRGVLTSNGIKKRFIEVDKMRDRWRNRKGKQAENTEENGANKTVFPVENLADNSEEYPWENPEVTGESKVKQSKAKESKVKDINNTTVTADGPNIFVHYEQNFGMLSAIVRDTLIDLEKTYGETWVKKAMGEAIVHNVRKISYFEKILRDWKVTGHPEPWTIEKETQPQRRQYPTSGQARNNQGVERLNNGRPKLQIISKEVDDDPLSPEQIEELRAMARRMDERNGIIPKSGKGEPA